jgi:hypothetical protein
LYSVLITVRREFASVMACQRGMSCQAERSTSLLMFFFVVPDEAESRKIFGVPRQYPCQYFDDEPRTVFLVHIIFANQTIWYLDGCCLRTASSFT